MIELKNINKNFKTVAEIEKEVKTKFDISLELYFLNFMKNKRLNSKLLIDDIEYNLDTLVNSNRSKKALNNLINIYYLNYLLAFSNKLIADKLYKMIKNNEYIDILTIKRLNDSITY